MVGNKQLVEVLLDCKNYVCIKGGVFGLTIGYANGAGEAFPDGGGFGFGYGYTSGDGEGDGDAAYYFDIYRGLGVDKIYGASNGDGCGEGDGEIGFYYEQAIS